MFSKRIAAAFVGTALAASAVVAPQVTAAPAEDSVAVAGYHGKGKCDHHKPKPCPTKPTKPKPTKPTKPTTTVTQITTTKVTETSTTQVTQTTTSKVTETISPEVSSVDDNGAIVGAAAFGLSAIAGSAPPEVAAVGRGGRPLRHRGQRPPPAALLQAGTGPGGPGHRPGCCRGPEGSRTAVDGGSREHPLILSQPP